MKKIYLLIGIILLSLVVFFAVSCEKEQKFHVSDLSFTPCKQDILKNSKRQEKVDVKFNNKDVQITYRNFEVTCDFTTVDVTYTFVNGVLRITQEGTPNLANCICYTDVSYTIEGISQNDVNVIFINGVQVYCYNDNNESENTNGIIIGYTKCYDLIGLFIITEKQDSLLSFNIPFSSININPDSLAYGIHNMKVNICFDYRIAVGEEIKQIIEFLCPENHAGVPAGLGGPIENYTQIIITDIKLKTP